jgi:hypothetical protein
MTRPWVMLTTMMAEIVFVVCIGHYLWLMPVTIVILTLIIQLTNEMEQKRK